MKLPKIFVTVGSTNFKFDSLFTSLDRALIKNKNNYSIEAQVGRSDYKWIYKRVKIYDYIDPGDMISQIKSADKIISHAGPISIYQIAKYAKNIPLIVPRLAKFKEHVDNHQLYFTKFLREVLPIGLQKYFVLDENIQEQVKDFLQEKPRKNNLREFLFKAPGQKNLVRNLEIFINGKR